MDTVTYPHFLVSSEMERWVEDRIDVSEHSEVARAFSVSAVPVAVAVTPDGRIVDRMPNFVEPDAFAAWLTSVRGRFESER